jgi:multidrug efflux system membrane fusion protein
VRVGLASDTGFPYSGELNFVNNQVDSATGTINLRAMVPNPMNFSKFFIDRPIFAACCRS